MSARAPADEQDTPAEYDGYSPGCLLIDVYGSPVVHLPLSWWPTVAAWHQNLSAKPMQCVDIFGQILSIDRAHVARIECRDLPACIALHENEQRQKARNLLAGDG